MIIIPMAGLSSRFFKAGYTKPKYMLEAYNETLFEHAVNSFKEYFSSKTFLFIVRDLYETSKFVEEQAKKLGIKNFIIKVLKAETRGQAETVTLGLEGIKHQGAITIFNIDTFRPNFIFPAKKHIEDGYLEVFKGSGDNWSFAKPVQEGSSLVAKTTEKDPISDLCCTGLYHFSDIQDYLFAYNKYLQKPQETWEKGELYVAPLYNILIEEGKKIHYYLIERKAVIFCGVPSEYDDFLKHKPIYE